jgi:microcompartment protein CcmL/EutN
MSISFGLIESKGLVALVEAADVILKNSPVEILGVHKLNNGLTALAVSGDQDYVNAAVESAADAGKRVGEINAFTVINQPPKQVMKIFGDLFSVSMEYDELIPDSNEESNLKVNRIKVSENEKLKIRSINVKASKEKEKSEAAAETAHSEKESKKITSDKAAQFKHKVKSNLSSSQNIIKQKESADSESTNSESEIDLNLSTIERLRREALGSSAKKIIKERAIATAPVKRIKAKRDIIKSENQKADYELIDKMNVHKLRNYARKFPNFPIKGREISRANRDELIEYFKKTD